MYEFLIATGRADGASTDKTVEMALIYESNGQEVVSDYFRPGQYSNRNNAYENGQMDICGNIPVKKNGESITTNDFIGVMVKFYDKTWQLDKIWVTNEDNGKTRWASVNRFLGSSSGLGTQNHPYRVDFVTETLASTKRGTESFKLEIKTASGHNYGTDDHVYFKLFDDTGYSCQTARAHMPGDQYEQGVTNTIYGFNTTFGPISKNITKVLIVKVGSDMWVPEHMITSTIGKSCDFSVINHLPPEGSLDSHHNWTMVPEKSSRNVEAVSTGASRGRS